MHRFPFILFLLVLLYFHEKTRVDQLTCVVGGLNEHIATAQEQSWWMFTR